MLAIEAKFDLGNFGQAMKAKFGRQIGKKFHHKFTKPKEISMGNFLKSKPARGNQWAWFNLFQIN